MSVITLAETLVAPGRSGRLEDADRALSRLEITPLPLGPDAPARLAALRAATGPKLPDCCVLMAAEDHSASVASFDRDLIDAARQLGLETLA